MANEPAIGQATNRTVVYAGNGYDGVRLLKACQSMLFVEKENCARYGTGSVHGQRVRMLLEALNLGTLEDWVKSEEWTRLRRQVYGETEFR